VAQTKTKKRALKADATDRVIEKIEVGDGTPENRSKFLKKILAPIAFIFRPLRWLGRKIIPRYFRNSLAELKLVKWPNRKETRQLTTAVLLFAIVLGTVVSLVDYGLDDIFKKVVLKQ